MSTDARAQAYLFLAVATLCYGLNANLSRLAVGEVSPMLIVALRWLIVVTILTVITRRRLHELKPVFRQRWLYLLLMGGFGLTLFNGLFYLAGHTTSALNIGIIQGAIPVCTVAGAVLLYRTPVRSLQIVGIAVTLGGVVVVASRGEWSVLAELTFREGDLYMLIACVLYAGYSLGLRRAPALDHLTLFLALSIAALIVSIPLAVAEFVAGHGVWPTPRGWLITLIAALLPSFAGQVLYLKGVTLIGPGRASTFLNLVPIVAAIIAVGILDETFLTYHALALAFVLGGITLAELGGRETTR